MIPMTKTEKRSTAGGDGGGLEPGLPYTGGWYALPRSTEDYLRVVFHLGRNQGGLKFRLYDMLLQSRTTPNHRYVIGSTKSIRRITMTPMTQTEKRSTAGGDGGGGVEPGFPYTGGWLVLPRSAEDAFGVFLFHRKGIQGEGKPAYT